MARPNHIDLGPRSFDQLRAATPSPGELPSPRSGDVPPPLSPLDAFALQSRLLAKRLEESHIDGHRMSRLPPHTIASELAKSRNGYFGSLSAASAPSEATASESRGLDLGGEKAIVAQSEIRPKSVYPSIQAPDDHRPESAWGQLEGGQDMASLHDRWQGVPGVRPAVNRDFFGRGRSGSPEPFTKREPTSNLSSNVRQMKDTRGRPPSLEPRKQSANDSLKSNDSNMLYPPRSPAFSRSSGGPPSIRSVQDSGEDSDAHSFHGDSRDRSLPPGYSPYRPRSPFSPVFAPPRSPSMSSEYSVSGGRAPLPQSFNFSRPISRTGKPSVGQTPLFEAASRQSEEISPPRPSLDVPPTRPSLDVSQPRPSLDVLSLQESIGSPGLPPVSLSDNVERPSIDGSIAPSSDTEHGPQPAPSYIYTKYSLPRGRVLTRESMLIPDPSTYVFEWEQPISGTNVTPVAGGQSEVPRTVDIDAKTQPLAQTPFLAPDTALSSQQHTRSRSTDGTSSTVSARTAILRTIPTEAPTSLSRFPDQPRSSAPSTPLARRGAPRTPTNTALFAPITRLRADSLTPEEHLAEGISCHQEGALQKSTYHLRIAAYEGLPTAMLLYALACRHGWGMRPNASEGVGWLRRAVDTAGLEVAYDEESVAAAAEARKQQLQNGQESGTTADGRPSTAPTANGISNGQPRAVADYTARKTHKAQFALSIYELGVSYMNGWGIAQDRALALRCFEIAGSWGDADALAEAGFCYAKGVGCKKDLRKAAGLYRRAEAKGVEMAGNSWIYKDKYMSPADGAESKDGRGRKSRKEKDKDDKEKEKEKKPREKSRTRTIFGGRKRSATAIAAAAPSTTNDTHEPAMPLSPTAATMTLLSS